MYVAPSYRVKHKFSVIVQATSKEGKDGGIELVKPPENSKIGDKVYFEGSDYECEAIPKPPRHAPVS